MEKDKRQFWISRGISLIVFIVTVSIIVLSEVIFKETRQAIIASLIVGILGVLFELRIAINESSKNISMSTQEVGERLVRLLSVHNRLFYDSWLREALGNIVQLKELAEKQAHDLARFEKIIGHALERAKSEVGTSFRIETKDDELERIIRLRDAVENAKLYVYAVTFDARDYLDRFWDKVFGSEYIKSNISAARRGVKISRIFVVKREILDGRDLEKYNMLCSLARALERAGRNMEIRFAAIEDLPVSLQECDTSFLVADNYVGSESDGASNGKQILGYVSYGDKVNVVEPLLERFEKLLPHTSKLPRRLARIANTSR